MRVEIEVQRAGGRRGDVRQIRAVAADHDALELVRKGAGGAAGDARRLEPGDLRRERDGPGDVVIGDGSRGGVDVEHRHQSLLAEVIALPSARFGERQEARDVELRVVQRHSETARLKMPGAVGIIGEAVAQVHMADDAAGGGR